MGREEDLAQLTTGECLYVMCEHVYMHVCGVITIYRLLERGPIIEGFSAMDHNNYIIVIILINICCMSGTIFNLNLSVNGCHPPPYK